MAMKNVWSLQVDEAIVSEHLKDYFQHNKDQDYDIFFPVNSHLKNIDLIVYNMKTHKTKTVQVKASRSYLDKGFEYGWHRVAVDKFDSDMVDFFIFVTYFSEITKEKREIKPVFAVIPTTELLKIIKNYKEIEKNGDCRFSFYHDGEHLSDYGSLKSHIDKENGIDFSKYLNNFELLKK